MAIVHLHIQKPMKLVKNKEKGRGREGREMLGTKILEVQQERKVKGIGKGD